MKKNKKNIINSTIHQYVDNLRLHTVVFIIYYLQMAFQEFWINNSKETQDTSCQMNMWPQLSEII